MTVATNLVTAKHSSRLWAMSILAKPMRTLIITMHTRLIHLDQRIRDDKGCISIRFDVSIRYQYIASCGIVFDEDLHSTFIPQLLLQQQQIDMMEEKWKILRLFYPQSCRDIWSGLGWWWWRRIQQSTTTSSNNITNH